MQVALDSEQTLFFKNTHLSKKQINHSVPDSTLNKKKKFTLTLLKFPSVMQLNYVFSSHFNSFYEGNSVVYSGQNYKLMYYFLYCWNTADYVFKEL